MIDLILGSCVVIDSYNNLREVKIKQWMFSELPHITHPVIKWVEEEKKRKEKKSPISKVPSFKTRSHDPS
jgi:hypothetical protein